MSPSVLRKTLPFALVLLALAGCDSPTGVCTLIGCDSGLAVQLDRVPVGAFTVEVLPEVPLASPPVFRVECTDAANPCSSRILFPGVFSERVRVRITTTAGSITHPATSVSYQTSYPNGRQCSPACRQGTVAASVPE